jgi:hypothetical protein
MAEFKNALELETKSIINEYMHWFDVSSQAATSPEYLDKRINGIIACLKMEVAEGKVGDFQRKALLSFFKGFCKRNKLDMTKYNGIV